MTDAENSPQAHKPKVCKLAVCSLILCLAGFSMAGIPVVITAPVALIFGTLALKRINKSGGLLRGRALAITGIVVSLLSMILLVHVVASWLGDKRDLKQTFACGTNLWELAQALSTYAAEHDGKYPAADKWCDSLLQNGYVTASQLRCPANKDEPCSYAMNPNASPASPNDVILLFETKGGWNQFGGPELLVSQSHDDGCNMLLVNGEVEFKIVGTDWLKEYRWKVEDANNVPLKETDDEGQKR